MPNPLRLALVSDIHHGEDKLTKRGSASLGLLDDFLAFAAGWGPDMIVELGDRISDIDQATDVALEEDVAARFVNLNTPHMHLNGNHDVAFLGEAANADTLRQKAGSHSLELKGWRLIFWQADAFIPYPDPFTIRRSDLDWLARNCRKAMRRRSFSPMCRSVRDRWLGTIGSRTTRDHAGYPNAAEARALIEGAGHVVLCVSGHVHWNSNAAGQRHPLCDDPILVRELHDQRQASRRLGDDGAGWRYTELADLWAGPDSSHPPLRKPGDRWPEPLAPLRHQKRAWRENAALGDVEALVFDLDGVLYRDDDPIPNAREFVAWANAQGLKIAAVTNNAGKTADDYAAKLARMGYDIPASNIITAGMATARFLAIQTPGARIHALGAPALLAELEAVGCIEVGDKADYVVAGISYDMTVGDLSQATRILRSGAKLIITNPDQTHPTPHGYAPEAGAVQAFLETSGGKACGICQQARPIHLSNGAGSVGRIGQNDIDDRRHARNRHSGRARHGHAVRPGRDRQPNRWRGRPPANSASR